VPVELLWYLPPEQHVLEIIVFNLIFGIGLYVTLKQGRNRKQNVSAPENVLSIPLKILRLILVICLTITVGHKFYGEKMALMLMPCHIATAFYLYALCVPTKADAQAAFNISIHYQFFTWLAIAMPDHSGLNQIGEILNFWIHHWILCFIPLFLIFTRHFELDKEGHYYFKLAICIGGLLHYDAMLIAAILTGHNVSYMLFPPPKSPMKGPLFRFGHMLFLVFMGWVGGYLVPRLVIFLSKWLRFQYHQAGGFPATKSKAQ